MAGQPQDTVEADSVHRLLLLIIEGDREASNLAATNLADFLNAHHASVPSALVGVDVIPHLRLLLVQGAVGYDEEDAARVRCISKLLAILHPPFVLRPSPEALREACDTLVRVAGEDIQADLNAIMAWARATLSSPEDVALKTAVDTYLADAQYPSSEQDHLYEGQVLESFIKLDNASLPQEGSAHAARLTVFALAASASSTLATLLGTFCSSPLFMGVTSIDPYETKLALPEALQAHRDTFGEDPVFPTDATDGGDEGNDEEVAAEQAGVEEQEEHGEVLGESDAEVEESGEEGKGDVGDADEEVQQDEDADHVNGSDDDDDEADEQLVGQADGEVLEVEQSEEQEVEHEEQEDELEPAVSEAEDDDDGPKFTPEEVEHSFQVASLLLAASRPIVADDLFDFLASKDQAIRMHGIGLINSSLYLATGETSDATFARMYRDQLLPRLMHHMRKSDDDTTEILDALKTTFRSLAGFRIAAGEGAREWCDFLLELLERDMDASGGDLELKYAVLIHLMTLDYENNAEDVRVAFRNDLIMPHRSRWVTRLKSLLQHVEADKAKYEEYGSEYMASFTIRELATAWKVDVPPELVTEGQEEDALAEEGTDQAEEGAEEAE